MTSTLAPPRSILSLLFIGIFLGPGMLMLWLGRWKWALGYFLLGLAAGFATGELEDRAILDGSIVFAAFTRADLWTLAIVGLIGLVHGFRIRHLALTRPWYRWIAGVPAIAVLLLIVLVYPVRILVLQPFNIPSSSLAPNYMVGDYVLASKWRYGYSRHSFPLGLLQFDGRVIGHAPERGDVAVFKLPTDTGVDYVKRVIGLPGDRIQMIHGVLQINGAPVKLEPVQLPDMFTDGGRLTFQRETLPNGRSYVIANEMDGGPADDTEEYTIPEGHYFMMGDNRDNSQDSRFADAVGMVPEENLIGPIAFRIWNSEGVPIDNRPEETTAGP